MLYKGTFTNNLAGCEKELLFSSDDINKVYDFMQNNLYEYLISYEHLVDEDLLEDYYDSGDYEVEEIEEVDEDEEIIKL